MLKDNYYSEPSEIDQRVFAQLVPADHYLRRVKASLDFERLRPQLSAAYKPTLGRPAEDPVLMFKLAFLQFHYDLSDRELIAEVQVNVAMRFFLDLALTSKLPHDSSLSVFRSRLGHERFQQLFDEIVALARAKGLIKDRLRLKDATHIIASITVPTTTQLVAETRQRLLDTARPFASARVAQEELEAAHIRLATADLSDQERLLQRVEHLRRIIAWGDVLKAELGASSVPPDKRHLAFEQMLELAHKVLRDREQPHGGDKLLCLSDPEARSGKHGQYYSGYLLDVLVDADSEFITALGVLAANADQAADAGVLVAQEEARHHNDIELLSIDKAGWRGELLAQWRAEQGLGLEVIVPPAALTVAAGYFVADEFSLVGDDSLRCPGGKTTSTRHRSSKNAGWQYEFSKQDCATCPLRGQCISGSGTRGRGVLKNDYAGELQAARARATTAQYRQVRKQHKRVEGKLAELVWQQRGRFARYRGRLRLRIQYLMLGLVVNIKRMVNLLQPLEPRGARRVC